KCSKIAHRIKHENTKPTTGDRFAYGVLRSPKASMILVIIQKAATGSTRRRATLAFAMQSIADTTIDSTASPSRALGARMRIRERRGQHLNHECPHQNLDAMPGEQSRN
ncbi:MAG: hypothetical protein WAU92_06045, partial [Candidatus Sulfotelmatobacter sp.]